MKKTVAVVVTYNRKALLEENIKALLNQTEPLDIYIVDNYSTDGTEEVVKKYIGKNLKYFNTGANLGGAGGFNYGLKLAYKGKYNYCWLMDDDTIPNKESLEAMISKAKEIKDDFSFMSSVTLWTDGSLCTMNVQGVSSKAIHGYKSLNKGLLELDYASFVSCFINMESLKKVGYPITDFFIYGDDMEYTMRLSKDKPGFLNPNSVVVHKMGSNDGINIIDIDSSRIDRYYYNYRNLCYIYRNYNKREYKVFKVKAIYMFFKILFKAKDHRFKRIHALLKGMRHGKRFNPSIEYVKE